MTKSRLLCGILSLSLIFQWDAPFAAASAVQDTVDNVVEAEASGDYMDKELLVTYKTAQGSLNGLPDGVEEEALTDTCSLVTAEEDGGIREVLQNIEKDRDVAYVEPNYTLELLDTQDTHSSKQWAYYNADSNINAQNAWALGKGENKEVIVAVIDTGIDYLHADLADNIWTNEGERYKSYIDNDGNNYPGDYYGWNFSDNSSVVCNYEFEMEAGQRVAVDFHGTHIAGIISAVADNGKGIAGLASYSNVKLMSVKVMGMKKPNGAISDLVKAIQYAQDNGATICNMSMGTGYYSRSLYQAMENSSLLFVCAAGNGDEKTNGIGYDISETPCYPASFDLENIISVANVNSTGSLDSSSCYSAEDVDIAAPGTAIASCYVDEKHSDTGVYVESTGTSMATPFVTATAAMISSYYGGLQPEALKQMILEGSKKVAGLKSKVADGAYLDVYGAMTYNGLLASVTTSVKSVAKSNNKKYMVTVNNPRAEELTVLYAKGKKDAAYFDGGQVGTSLELNNHKATITVTETANYTVYLKDSQGNEKVYSDKVKVPVLTKMTLSASSKSLAVGKSYRIKQTLAASGVYAKITYKSSNTAVAKISSAGLVQAGKKGTALITVTAVSGDVKKTATCKITVK